MNPKLRFSALLLNLVMIAGCIASAGLFTVSADESASFYSLSTKETYYDSFTGVSMPYRLYVPENYDESKSYPIILFLHGAGESGTDNQVQIKDNLLLETLVSPEYIDSNPCIVVAPQSTCSWGDIHERVTVMNILLDLESRYNIDEDKHIIVGYSMGGVGVWNMLLLYPDYFDAAVPVAGGTVPGDFESIKDVSIWIFHASDDGVMNVDYSREMYKSLKDVGAKVYMTEPTTGGHYQNLVAYNNPDLYKWLFSETFPIPPDAPDRYVSPAIVICAVAGALVIIGGAVTAVVIRRRRKKAPSEDAEQ